jgi:hypothetical protein
VTVSVPDFLDIRCVSKIQNVFTALLFLGCEEVGKKKKKSATARNLSFFCYFMAVAKEALKIYD